MKVIGKIFAVFVVVAGLYYVWHVYYNYRFEEISPNKVYKSALIESESAMERLLLENKIKTVIDLLDPGVQDALNPAEQKEVDREIAYIDAINARNNLSIKHVNIPSGQKPTPETLQKFFEVLDDNTSYPVLIHCYHGKGRAVVYSALYRIEYENWSNSEARDKTRLIVEALGYRSSFADGKEKGDFLMSYKKRKK